MWLTNAFVDYPCIILVLSFCILSSMAVVAYNLGYFELNLEGDRDMVMWDDPMV